MIFRSVQDSLLHCNSKGQKTPWHLSDINKIIILINPKKVRTHSFMQKKPTSWNINSRFKIPLTTLISITVRRQFNTLDRSYAANIFFDLPHLRTSTPTPTQWSRQECSLSWTIRMKMKLTIALLKIKLIMLFPPSRSLG